MTVAELIKQLQDLPPGTRVIVTTEYGIAEVSGVAWRWAKLGLGEFECFCERDAEGAVEVVEII